MFATAATNRVNSKEQEQAAQAAVQRWNQPDAAGMVLGNGHA